MSVRKSTVKKVQSFLQELQEGCESRDITNLRKTANFWGLSGGFYSPVLRGIGVVVKDPRTRTYQWTGDKPTKKLAKEILKVVNEYASATR